MKSTLVRATVRPAFAVFVALALIGVAIVPGCSGMGRRAGPGESGSSQFAPGRTPLATFDSFTAAFAARDFAAIYDLTSAPAQERFQSALQTMDASELAAALDLQLADLQALPARDAMARLTEAIVARSPEEFVRLTHAKRTQEPVVFGDECVIQRRLPDGLEDEIRLVRDAARDVWLLDDSFFGE
ncbi:MAG: hypothetical protein AB7O52_10900 [Planctomycetota bacterium]